MALGAFPLAEMVSLSCRRISARRSPFSADRDHLHHLLLDNGVSTAGAVLIVSMIVIATAVLAGALHYSNGSYGSAILAGVFVLFLHSVVVRFLVSRRGLKNRSMSAVRSRPATLENSYLKRRAR
jgi:UDP-GlcNAc:undecaprenyl-phosphate GlcNAc-1-phosphate transferase